MLQIDHLDKRYGGVEAVSNLTFEVSGGEILGLVGPNGAGKTTTLRCIAGILRPNSGSIRISGHDLAQEPVEAKRGLAFIPDEPRLFDYLTVTEHLEFTSRIYRVHDGAARATALLKELELTAKRDALPAELSRGMKQKLAIACGLVHDPQVLLFDEPLTGLDPAGIRRMKSTIAARALAGGAIIVSSHLLHLVQELCHRVLIIQNGRKVVHGTLDEIKALAPQLEAQATLEEIFLHVTGDGSVA
jgi:ABC-2 type transport system ATP-binding protein